MANLPLGDQERLGDCRAVTFPWTSEKGSSADAGGNEEGIAGYELVTAIDAVDRHARRADGLRFLVTLRGQAAHHAATQGTDRRGGHHSLWRSADYEEQFNVERRQ